MEKTFELASNLLQIFILVWFITKYFGTKLSRNYSNIAFLIIWIIAFLETSFINYLVAYDGFLSISVIITFVIYSQLCLRGSLSGHIFISCFAMAIIFTLASTLIFIFSYLSEMNPIGMVANFTTWRVFAVCVCRVCEAVVFSFVVKLNANYKLSKKEWGLFITMPLFTWFAVVLMTQATIVAPEILSQMFYIAIFLIVINIIIYFFMFKIKQDTQTKIEYELLKMQHDNIKSMEMNMKAICDSTYSIKHDLEKHLLAVKTMAENNKCIDICSYVDGIIDKGLNDVPKIVFTDNDVFNAIMNAKLALCRQKNIYTSINIANEAIQHITPSDVVVLFGNIFDNAIEAAENTVEKTIILIVRLQGEYVSIYMENSFDKKFSSIELKTTKTGSLYHGMGIKNIRQVVERHEGMIDYFQYDNIFCCDILLKKR